MNSKSTQQPQKTKLFEMRQTSGSKHLFSKRSQPTLEKTVCHPRLELLAFYSRLAWKTFRTTFFMETFPFQNFSPEPKGGVFRAWFRDRNAVLP